MYKYDAHCCNCNVRIRDEAIKSQELEIIRDGKIIGFIKENIDRYFGRLSLSYSIKGDVFDTFYEAIECLVYNVNLNKDDSQPFGIENNTGSLINFNNQ